MDIEYLSLVWLSDIRGAGTVSHKFYELGKNIELLCLSKQTVIPIVSGNALGLFSGSRNVLPFSVDLSHFCRSFRIESNTTIKIFIGHHVLLINEVHNVIKKNSFFFENLATIWYKIIFWTQNRMNWKLWRIIRRDLSFFVAAHCFLQREKLFNFDKVEHWVLILSKFWWETSQVVEYVGSWKKRVANVENGF